MTRHFSLRTLLGLALLITVMLGASLVAAPQGARTRGGQPSEGTAVPRESSPATPTTPAPTGGSNAPSPTPTARRPADGSTESGAAVERTVRRRTNGGGTVIVPGYANGFYPWGYGGLGFGDYYGGFYDPWYGGYPYYAQGYTSEYMGSLRLKVKPRSAEVYVDGFYAGIVDDFDGIFQRLHVEAGPHRIEIHAPGYETLAFDVRVEPDHTTTYRGELKPIP